MRLSAQSMQETTGYGVGFSYYKGNEYPVYSGAMVFDDETTNVHIHPDNPVKYELSKEFRDKLKKIEGFIPTLVRQKGFDFCVAKGVVKKPDPNTVYLHSEFGCQGGQGDLCGIYQCRTIQWQESYFSVMPYRIFLDESTKTISSEMGAYQFSKDHSTNSINVGSNKKPDFCYTRSNKDGEEYTNSSGNIVFNPRCSGSNEEEVAQAFIDFVVSKS